eukprot:906649-Ditylum_brightwellii.AAC.1
MEIKKDDSGYYLSADHFQSSGSGRTYSSRWIYHPEPMYDGGAILVCHTNGKICLLHQEYLSTSDSIKYMLKQEREAAED